MASRKTLESRSFYGDDTATWRSVRDRPGNAARLRDARYRQRRATRKAGTSKDVRPPEPENRSAAGPLRARHLLRGGSASSEPAIGGGEVPVVVLEQKEEVSPSMNKMLRKGNGDAGNTRRVEHLAPRGPSPAGPPGPRRARKLWKLTTPDLVLLSLLAERPMHGIRRTWNWSGARFESGQRFRGPRCTTRSRSWQASDCFGNRKPRNQQQGPSAAPLRHRERAANSWPMLWSEKIGLRKKSVRRSRRGLRSPGRRGPVSLKSRSSGGANS